MIVWINSRIENYLQKELRDISGIAKKRSTKLAKKFDSIRDIDTLCDNADLVGMNSIQLQHKLRNYFSHKEAPIQNLVYETKEDMLQNGDIDVFLREI